MTHEGGSVASLRGRVPTGYGKLDEALQGGFFAGSAVLLSAPASSEVPILLSNFLKASTGVGLLICHSLSSAEAITESRDTNLKCIICSEKAIPPSKNILPGKGIDNLTELNFQIQETISSVQPKRVVLNILSDILLRHKALQTRKWLSEFLEKLHSKDVTVLAVLNPYMHANEEVQAVVDLFDGNIEIVEKGVEGEFQKFLRIQWMQGLEATENELPLLLTVERLEPPYQPAVAVTHFKEPMWATSLVGRTVELSKLKAAFENACNNSSSLVAIHGEAGVGKTRLMQELAVYAQSKGATVLAGSASELGLAYAPWIEATRQYVAQAPGELLRRMLGRYASEIVKLVPDISAKLGTIPPSRPLGEQQDKIRFYEGVTQFFVSISREFPLLLLFDDMQSADQPSLELLEHLVRSTSNLPILTICSYRSEDVQANSPLYRALTKFNRQRVLETIQARNLTKEDAAELVRQTFGEQAISSEFADLIHHRTGGNPFFIEEVLRSLVEDGTIFRTESKWDRKPIQEIIIPQTVKSILRARLMHLDPATLDTLQLAAVAGSEFQFEVLLEVSHTDEDALFKRLEAAISQGLIVEVPHENGEFRFADNRIRELLLDDLIHVKKARYHVKLAEVMEKVYSKKLERQAESIATHFSEGGDAERAIKFSIVAGDYSRSIHAHEQAIRNYQRALSLTDVKELGQRASIYEKLGQCYSQAGQFSNSLESCQQALVLYANSNDSAACTRISTQCSRPLYAVKGIEETVSFLRDAVKYVNRTPESYEAAGLYGALASYMVQLSGRHDEAKEWSQRALEAGEKSGNFAATSDALQDMAYSLLDNGRIDEGLSLLERGLEVATQHNLYYQVWNALLNLACYVYPRDLLKARDYISRWLAYAQEENNVYIQASATVYLAFFDWLRGDWAEASREFDAAFEVKNRLGFKFLVLNPEAWRAQLFLGVGHLEKADESCRLALERHDEQVAHIVAVNLALGKLRLEQGMVEEAKAYFEAGVKAFKDFEFTTFPLWHIETLLHLSKIHAEQQRLDNARELVDWGERLARTVMSGAGLAMASQARATLLFAIGDKNRAKEVYLESLELWEKAGWPFYHAKALVDYSEAIAQADPKESRNRLDQAAELFRKLGAVRDLEKAKLKLLAM